MASTLRVRRAVVLGAGTMGGAISAHLANSGIPNDLLDVRGAGADPNGPAAAGLERALRSRPPAFYDPSLASLVKPGNLTDDLARIEGADWVLEAVVEDPGVKAGLFARIAPHLKRGAVLSTNTSGIPLRDLAAGLPAGLGARFLGTHFFNPPRYLRLLEIIPAPGTDPGVLDAVEALAVRRLGKGVVRAKDTPGFIANRIGTFALLHAVHLMLEEGRTPAEVDLLTGRAAGRPKSATLRTADLVGLDVLARVVENLREKLPEDPERDLFRLPDFLKEMIRAGRLGEKSGGGFYAKVPSGGASEVLMIDPATGRYVPRERGTFASLEMARSIDDPAERIRRLAAAPDDAGRFVWKNLSALLRYAALVQREISDDVADVDRAMRWGFGWDLGPFETWDALGVAAAAARMEREGTPVPPLVCTLLESGATSFYRSEKGSVSVFHAPAVLFRSLPDDPRRLDPSRLKDAGGILLDDPDATLVDLGDRVACLEIHTKLNTIGPGVLSMMERSLDLVDDGWRGLVLAGQGADFSAGANLLLILNALEDDEEDEVEWFVRRFQRINRRLRFGPRPVVAAPRGRTLGGGCEIVLAAGAVAAAAETYIGLVEVGAGVIPAGGGCMEFVKRANEAAPEGADLFPWIRRAFETVGRGKVATSAVDGRRLGFLRSSDGITPNPDHLLHDAKAMVLALDERGDRPAGPREDLRVVGESGLAALRSGLHNLRAGGAITEHDREVGDVLAWVLCGGEIAPSSPVSEDYLLDLERLGFMRLCSQGRTRDRMEHLLKTGKPLRN